MKTSIIKSLLTSLCQREGITSSLAKSVRLATERGKGRFFNNDAFPMNSFVLFIAFLLIAGCWSLDAAEIRDCVAAFVDNTAITMSELEEAYKKASELAPGITKEEVLNTMINKVLLLREAKKIGLEASSEDELLKEYADLKIRAFIRIREEEITAFYEKHVNDFQGKELESVRDEIEGYLTEKEVNERLKSRIKELREKAYIKIEDIAKEGRTFPVKKR
jgi:hypothetical protein